MGGAKFILITIPPQAAFKSVVFLLGVLVSLVLRSRNQLLFAKLYMPLLCPAIALTPGRQL